MKKKHKGINGNGWIVVLVFVAGQTITGLLAAGSIKSDVANIDRRLTKVEDKVDNVTVQVAKIRK